MLTKDVLIHEDGFGMVGCDIIRRYTLTNKNKASVCLISFGAGIQSIRVPNKKGILGDVVLGWDDINGYLENRFIGRTIGRTTSIIINGFITSIREKSSVRRNFNDNNRYHLNGRFINFDDVNWDSYVINKSVVMSYLSCDGSDDYPGDVLTQIKYTWTDDNELFMNVRATSTRSTVANISNYCVFNLAGQATGYSELNKHVITVNADKWVSMDDDKLPTVKSVNRTVFDLRKPTMLGSKILRQVPGGGFDHTFCINSPSTWCYRFHARVLHPESGRFVEVYSNQPGIYLSTVNYFPDLKINDLLDRGSNNCGEYVNVPSRDGLNTLVEDKTMKMWGKCGILYQKHSGLTISPINCSSFVNMEHFPSSILHPGNVYKHNMSLKFGVKV